MTQNANYTPANIFGVSCVGLTYYIFMSDTAYDVEWNESVLNIVAENKYFSMIDTYKVKESKT